MQVNKVAVIGSGVMGSGIAAQAANGGLDVLLLDIVPDGAENRNQLACQAIEKQLKSGGFAHADCAKRVTAGNLEDDLAALGEADWIIEVVVEKIAIKHSVFKTIDAARKPGSVVSSNTSTIPLAELMAPMPDSFKRDFAISHFFNPPRQMRLIEMVPSPQMEPARYEEICDVADHLFGKSVVHCKDTPGFIANRIGIYWLTYAMNSAMKHGMAVELADQLLSKPVGVPKTGIFGLYDLIGLDLMPLIAEAMQAYVPDSEAYRQLEPKPDPLKRMLDDGYTGRKGKGGFYRMQKLDNGGRVKEVIDLSTGEYHPVMGAPLLESCKSKDIKTLLETEDTGGAYARDVMITSLHYAACLLGEIADDMDSIDKAMRYGYSWKLGPFELIDQIGTAAFADHCTAVGLEVPAIIDQARGQPLYKNGKQLTLGGDYQALPRAPGVLKLSDHGQPLETYEKATLWNMGDDIFCLEITSKMHSIDNAVLDGLEAALDYTSAHGKGLVIGSEQPYFSAGANLNFFLENARSGHLDAVDALIKRGQDVMQRIKLSPKPIVCAASGIALGGGCELLLHASAVQPHMECRAGLVEVGVGLIPGWGGCKEALAHRVLCREDDAEKLAALTACYADMLQATTVSSAFGLKDMGLTNLSDGMTMNVERLLADAKHYARTLSAGFTPHIAAPISLPSGSKAALEAWLAKHQEELAPHTQYIATQLIEVLTLAEGREVSEQDMLDKEREIFMRLLATEPSQARIEHMLNTGKPLRN